MPTNEIPRERWPDFLHNFSSAHQGWLATVEVFGDELGAQVEARELPFEGITAEMNKPGSDRIALMIGGRPDSHVTHTITGATHIRLDQTEYGENEALQIEAPGQAVTLVRFRPPIGCDSAAGVIIE